MAGLAAVEHLNALDAITRNLGQQLRVKPTDMPAKVAGRCSLAASAAFCVAFALQGQTSLLLFVLQNPVKTVTSVHHEVACQVASGQQAMSLFLLSCAGRAQTILPEACCRLHATSYCQACISMTP